MIEPLVTVVTITYNHENYIAQTIEGVLMQKVNFPIEFIISDDSSPDDTESIVKYYEKSHPNGSWIKYTKHERNKGVNKNFIWALGKAKGKYIAICEGDDFWTDSLKLQKQVDFLEKNEEFVISFHDCEIQNNNGEVLKKSKLGDKRMKSLSSIEVVSGSLIPTHTVLYRKVALPEIPKEFMQVLNADTFLFALLGQSGKAYYHADIKKAVYRIHGNGIWSELNPEMQLKSGVNTYSTIARIMKDKKYKKAVLGKLSTKFVGLALIYLSEKKALKFLHYYFQVFFLDLRIRSSHFLQLNQKIFKIICLKFQ